MPEANKALLVKDGNGYEVDNFTHEQSLLIQEYGKQVLIGGCAHSGIENIIAEAEEMTNKQVDTVISGFHLYNPANRKYEQPTYIQQLGDALANHRIDYYSCHCTGPKAFDILQPKLVGRLHYFATGDEIVL